MFFRVYEKNSHKKQNSYKCVKFNNEGTPSLQTVNNIQIRIKLLFQNVERIW